jgi:hypothetical protein
MDKFCPIFIRFAIKLDIIVRYHKKRKAIPVRGRGGP